MIPNPRPADDAGKDEEQGQVRPALDEPGAEDVVHRDHRDAPHQQEGPRPRRAGGVEPDHRRDHDQDRTDLGDAEHEDHRGQQPRIGDPGNGQADPRDGGLHHRGHYHPQRDGPDGPSSELHRLLAPLAGESMEEATQPFHRDFARGVEDRREDDGEQEVHHHPPHGPDLGAEPANRRADVRGEPAGDLRRVRGRKVPPRLRQAGPEGDGRQPGRRLGIFIVGSARTRAITRSDSSMMVATAG